MFKLATLNKILIVLKYSLHLMRVFNKNKIQVLQKTYLI